MNNSSNTLVTPQTSSILQNEEKIYKKEKQILLEFDLKTKDLKTQLNEGVKCLEQRLDTQISILYELQDFFKKRAEVELQYSKDLDKLVKQIQTKHKSEKSKRETWNLYSNMQLWESLLSDSKQHSKYHQVLSEICSKHVSEKFDEIIEDCRRIFNKCRNVSQTSHSEVFKVISELNGAMKTYHEYQSESKQAEAKLKYVQSQKPKYEKQKSQKKLKQFEKQIEKRQQKYTETKVKAFKARNEYILGINSSNACISKYCKEDIGDMIDCMDFGFHGSIAKCVNMYISGQDNIKRSRQITIDNLSRAIGDLDSNADKQNYLDYFSPIFNIQKKFQFEPHKGDEVSQVNAQSLIRYDMEKRYEQLEYRLKTLKTENDEIFKTIEATEQSLLNYFDLKNTDMSDLFKDLNLSNSNQNNSKGKRIEIEDYYIEKFRQYTISSNLIARLEARHSMMKKALNTVSDRTLHTQDNQLQLAKEQKPKKKIGKAPLIGQPRLFGGKLIEYINATKQEIPLIITSCIKAINRLGLHNQGIFRIPGSLGEINQFKDAFEKGEDPLITVNPREMNSVAGVLKLYFRELKDPLFPREMFDTFMDCMKTTNESEQIEQQEAQRIENIKKAMTSVPVQIFIVIRYFFAFLNHLSEFKDENMMDSYNIAVCLAPTLIPIPEDKRDQVNYQTDSIEFIKLIIQNNDEICPTDLYDGPIYEKFDIECDNNSDDNAESEDENDDESEKHFLRSLSDDEFYNIDAVALYDYKGRTSKELSFKKGDKISIKGQLSADWWLGALDDSKYGYIPDKYIALRNTKRKGSNVSYDFDVTKTNLCDLMRSKESDIVNDDKLKIEGSVDIKKKKMSYIEHALASVLNDMKQLDLNNSHNRSKNKSSDDDDDINNLQENSENNDDYDVPPDDNVINNPNTNKYSSSNELLSTSSSASINTIPAFNIVHLRLCQNDQLPIKSENLVNTDILSDRPDLVLDLPVNVSLRSITPNETFNNLPRSVETPINITNLMQSSIVKTTTPSAIDNLLLSSKIDFMPTNSTSNKINADNKTSTPVIRTNSYNGEINQKKLITNSIKTDGTDGNLNKISTSSIKNDTEIEIKIANKKPPPTCKKPDKSEELLRKLNKSSDSSLKIQISKSKATDV